MNNETAQDWVRQLVADLRVALSEGRTDRILALVGPFRFRGELAKWLGKGLEKDAFDDAELYATDIRNALGDQERTEQAIDGLAQLFNL